MPSLPSKSTLPSLASLADLPDVPSPVLALVGVGDAAAEAARELKAKLVAVDPSALDPRDRDVTIDLSALKPEGMDFSKVDPRNLDVTKLDPRNIDPAAVTATGLLWAAKGQERYESLVARGEAVITHARGSEWSDAVADDATAVAEPPVAEAPVATPPAAKKTTPAAKSTTKKTAAPKADPEA
jgi:hypothetical protein